MRTVIVYESVFGNTRQVAEAIAGGIRVSQPGSEVACVPVSGATASLVGGADLLIAGGPTHMRGMSSRMTRRKGAEGEQQKTPGLPLEPGYGDDGLREWFASLGQTGQAGQPAAAFDTRVASRLAGGAARKIGRLLRGHGYRVLAQEGFIIDGSAHGPLRAGETVRAASWGADLVRQVAASSRAADARPAG
jgi:hypothetical protein